MHKFDARYNVLRLPSGIGLGKKLVDAVIECEWKLCFSVKFILISYVP